MYSTQTLILEAFNFWGLRIERRSLSFERLLTYFCMVLYVGYFLVLVSFAKTKLNNTDRVHVPLIGLY